MCFALYAGTTQPLPRRRWRQDAPDISVEPLLDYDGRIKTLFSKREVQYIGSTSGCGCGFPYAALENGAWPEIEHPRLDMSPREFDHTQRNREGLVNLLKTADEEFVELFGISDGDVGATPKARENITITRILNPNFFFKEQGFYRVGLNSETGG